METTCGYRVVLSIDGGGIRGVIPLVLLNHIEANMRLLGYSMSIPDVVDVFSGTSTGSVISGSLMLKGENGRPRFDVRNMLNLYIERGQQIFNRDSGAGIQRSQYPFRMVLDANFSEYKLKELTREYLFVSYDMKANRPYFFSTDNRLENGDLSLADAMMASSAVPGYFPPFAFGEYELADGMLTAKNPSLYAYHYARKKYPQDKLLVVSLGTGCCPKKQPDWIDADVMATESQMKLMEKQDYQLYYLRFQPELLSASYQIDDTSRENLHALVDDALTYVHAIDYKFYKLFDLLKIKLAG
jgi:uncharacterized protein